MTKQILLLLLIAGFTVDLAAQNVDSLKERQSELRDQIRSLETDLKQTTAKIPPELGWSFSYSGTLGFTFNRLNNWATASNPNSETSAIQVSMLGRANLREENYFWRNTARLNLGWQRQDLKRDDVPDESKYEPTVDVLQINSLYGYKIGPKLSLSAMAEFRTTIIENAFDPAYLDIGTGATWTPNDHWLVVLHPLNYNFIIASDELDFESSLGTKLLVEYSREIIDGFLLSSNFTGFMSYEDADDLSNFTWTTGLNFRAFRGIGVGIEYALRWNKQETRNLDDDIQSYFLVGLSYTL